MSCDCSYSTVFTIFSYQRTIFDTLPTRYQISVILRQCATSFDIASDTLTALAVGRQPSTFTLMVRLQMRRFDGFRLHSAISGILRPKPQVRLGSSCRIWSFQRAFCRSLVLFVGSPRCLSNSGGSWGKSPDERNSTLLLCLDPLLTCVCRSLLSILSLYAGSDRLSTPFLKKFVRQTRDPACLLG